MMCSPSCLNNLSCEIWQWLDPRALPVGAICSSLVKTAKLAMTTLCVVVACTVINPYICPAGLLIGMIWHDVTYEAMNKELFTPICLHWIISTITMIVAFLVAPHFFLLAGGTLFNAYYGSQINYNRQETQNN